MREVEESSCRNSSEEVRRAESRAHLKRSHDGNDFFSAQSSHQGRFPIRIHLLVKGTHLLLLDLLCRIESGVAVDCERTTSALREATLPHLQVFESCHHSETSLRNPRISYHNSWRFAIQSISSSRYYIVASKRCASNPAFPKDSLKSVLERFLEQPTKAPPFWLHHGSRFEDHHLPLIREFSLLHSRASKLPDSC